MSSLWERLATSKIYDLAHPLERGTPVSPNHPAFQIALMRRHGDMVRVDGASAANEVIVTGGHVGTHIDALGHVSQDGLVYGGIEASTIQSQFGLSKLGVDTIEPIFCRGVLLDVASAREVDVLDPGTEVTVADLERSQERAGVTIGEGDAVLIRTGWAAHFADAALFGGQVGGAPGPGAEAGAWLAERRPRVVGGETIAFEVVRPGEGHSTLPVHRIMLVESGINIMEVMNLQPIADAGVAEFLFVAAPLKIRGATGSPFRPLAVVES